MENNYWVIIPAAGVGLRFKGEMPKQYYRLHNKTILEHSLRCFAFLPLIKKIIVPIAKNDEWYPHLKLPSNITNKIMNTEGGASRMESVFNALCYLKNKANPQDFILVHDAVRCCLHQEDLNTLIQSLKQNQIGGLLGDKVTDTIKFCSKNNILNTIDREPLWQALTPQLFRFEVLLNAFHHCISHNIAITDESSAVEAFGLTPQIVKANYPNPKLTYASDLDLFHFLLMNNVTSRKMQETT